MIKFNKSDIINKLNVRGKLPVDFDKQINNLLNKVKNRAEYEISDSSFYRSINEHILNKDKKFHCKSIALSISQDEANKAQHILEISMLHPTMMVEAKRPLACGNKNTIMKFLNSQSSINILKEDIAAMSNNLAQK